MEREIQEMLILWMNLWDRGLHKGLVGDSDAEGATIEGRSASKEEDKDNLQYTVYLWHC